MTDPVENTTPPDQEAAVPEPLSVGDKFIGILTEPSATYENMRQVGPKKSDWVVPILIMTIIIAIATYIRMSDPAMRDAIMQQQMEALEERVASGEMTQEQADRAMEMVESMGPMQAIFSVIGVLIFVPIVFLIIALVYWLLLKFGTKSAIPYSATLGAFGLTAYFAVIDQILAVLISLLTGNIYASVSPALFMTPDLGSPLFKIMNSLNPITIWSMYVLGIGFSIIGSISKAKAYIIIFGLWILWTLGAAFISLPFGMAG